MASEPPSNVRGVEGTEGQRTLAKSKAWETPFGSRAAGSARTKRGPKRFLAFTVPIARVRHRKKWIFYDGH